LPTGRIRVHLVYDAAEEVSQEIDGMQIVAQTSGIYKDVDGEAESRELRASWERNICD
jgi:hypothetical protein